MQITVHFIDDMFFDYLAEDFKNFNYDDAQTTNLYLGNINPKVGFETFA